MECYGNFRIFFIVSLIFGLFRPTSVWLIGVWGYSINQSLGGIPMLGPCESRNCILRNTREIRAYDTLAQFARMNCVRDLRACFEAYACVCAYACLFQSPCVFLLGQPDDCNRDRDYRNCECKMKVWNMQFDAKKYFIKPMLAKYAIAVVQDGITPSGKCKTSDLLR